LRIAAVKSEKGNVAIPLRRVGQIRLWDGDFLIPFESGSSHHSRQAGARGLLSAQAVRAVVRD
jgi:hypothetical protein